LLIGGTTAYDNNPAALAAILAAWNPQRRKDLIPEIVGIAARIGADRGALPIRTEPVQARAG